VASLTTVAGGADTLCVTAKVVKTTRVGCVVGLPGGPLGRALGDGVDGAAVGTAYVGVADGLPSGLALGYGLGPGVVGLHERVREGVTLPEML
jgi:hypothetical protein